MAARTSSPFPVFWILATEPEVDQFEGIFRVNPEPTNSVVESPGIESLDPQDARKIVETRRRIIFFIY